jgi:hypothetical protein
MENISIAAKEPIILFIGNSSITYNRSADLIDKLLEGAGFTSISRSQAEESSNLPCPKTRTGDELAWNQRRLSYLKKEKPED